MISLEFYPQINHVVYTCLYFEHKAVGINPKEYIVIKPPPDEVLGVEDWTNRIYKIRDKNGKITHEYRKNLYPTKQLAVLNCLQIARKKNDKIALEKYERLLWTVNG